MTFKNANASTNTNGSSAANAVTAPVAAPTTPVASITGPTAITSAEAAQCQALLGQIGGILGPVTALSADDIRRSLKLRKGGAQVVPQLVDLCKQHGVTSVGPLTPDTLSAQKARADTLNTIGVHFAAVGKMLSDATFTAESDTWQQATVLYAVLQRLAVINPTLAQGLQPVQAFFQTKKTKGRKREAEANARLAKEQNVAEKYAPPAPRAAGPAPVASSTGPSAGGSSATNVPAPATSEWRSQPSAPFVTHATP